MGEPLILALDQGTTSTRAILFTADGRALAEAGSRWSSTTLRTVGWSTTLRRSSPSR